MRRAQILLVLDNCEHLVDAVASLVATLLATCPELVILTTSRQPLAITGETTYRLPSLLDQDSIALFASRAAATKTAFVVNDENIGVIREVCRRLDGIPLAIELAAAHLKVLSADQLRRKLEDRFALLGADRRDAMPRHQTMRATIDWSHEQLHDAERLVFRRLGVFAGGWTLEAAEALCDDDRQEALDVSAVQAPLVDKSLVIAEIGGSDARYRLLESTRAFASEKLDAAAKRKAVSRRHAEWVAVFADDAYWRTLKPPLANWLPSVEIELGNVRAALAWTLERAGDVALGRKITGDLIGLWFCHREGRRWIDAALATVDDRCDEGVEAPLYSAKAWVTAGSKASKQRRTRSRCERRSDPFELGCTARALPSIDHAVALFVRNGLARACSYAAFKAVRAAISAAIGRHADAHAAFLEAIDLLELLGDERRANMQRVHFAKLGCAVGKPDKALQIVEAAIASFQASHDIGRSALRSAMQRLANAAEEGAWLSVDQAVAAAASL